MTPADQSADTVRHCQKCGGDLQVKPYGFDLDLPTVWLCLLCVWGPEGILTSPHHSDGTGGEG